MLDFSSGIATCTAVELVRHHIDVYRAYKCAGHCLVLITHVFMACEQGTSLSIWLS